MTDPTSTMRQDPPENPTVEDTEPVIAVPAGPPPAPPKKNLLESREFYVTLGLLAGVMLLGAVAIKMLATWRRKQVEPGRWEAGIELNNFREMLEAGEITHSEYEKIRDKMSAKLKKQVGITKIAPPPQDPPAAPPAGA
jgi:hypothetical protein